MGSIYISSRQSATNSVLTNALNLVGLSMIPTAFFAWLVAQIPQAVYMEHPIASICAFIGAFIVSIGLMFWAMKARNSGMGVVAMLLFAGVMGSLLGPTINMALSLKNGGTLILTAALATAAALFAVVAYINTTKKNFSFLGPYLFGSLVAMLILGIVGAFLGSTVFQLAVSSLTVLVFLGYLLYDVSEVVNGGEDNYIVAAIQIYLDLLNIFIHLLRILMIVTGNSSSDD